VASKPTAIEVLVDHPQRLKSPLPVPAHTRLGLGLSDRYTKRIARMAAEFFVFLSVYTPKNMAIE
jgi:hypothetical protein